jgi:hypothetical protein
MTNTTRHVIVSVLMLAFAGTRDTARAEETPAASTARVRSYNPAIVALIGQGIEQSATFRAMIETINASDGVVYVEQGRCGHGVRACLVHHVIATGSRRMLFVRLDFQKLDQELIGSIGHELRHAIEVLGDPHITSAGAMYFFYQREASLGKTGGAFETRAAIDAGDAVHAEVRAAFQGK